jgi:hypothetical protein
MTRTMILLTGHPELVPLAIQVLAFACVVPVAMIVLFIINISPFYQKRIAPRSIAFRIAFLVGEGISVIVFAKLLAVLGIYFLLS